MSPRAEHTPNARGHADVIGASKRVVRFRFADLRKLVDLQGSPSTGARRVGHPNLIAASRQIGRR